MLQTPRYKIKYPAGTDLVKDAASQFQQMAQSIDDNIDTLPAKITADLTSATTQAKQAATQAQQYATQAGNASDTGMATILTDTGKQSYTAISKRIIPDIRKVLVVGDSVSSGAGTSNPATKSWPAQLARYTGWTVYNYAEPNAAFVQAGTGANKANFAGQLKAAATAFGGGAKNITDVIIAGGVNDKANTSGVYNAVRSTLTQAHTTYPSARIHLVPVMLGRYGMGRYNNGTNIASLIYLIGEAAVGPWINLIPYAWEWNNGRADWAADDIHPNDAGAENHALCVRMGMDGTPPRPMYFSQGTPSAGVKVNQANIVCSSGVVSIDLNITITAAKPAYSTLVTVPEWASQRINGAMTCGLQSNTQAPFVYLSSAGQVASTGAIPANTQLYIAKAFPLGS